MNLDTSVLMEEQICLETNESEPKLTDFHVEQTAPAGISGAPAVTEETKTGQPADSQLTVSEEMTVTVSVSTQTERRRKPLRKRIRSFFRGCARRIVQTMSHL